jgi:hypothetical protein
MTAMAPATSSQRKCRLPCFEILPNLGDLSGGADDLVDESCQIPARD